MLRLSTRQTTVIVLALAAIVLVAGTAAACPTCKDGLAANDPQRAGLVKGYFYSILLMMGTPFLMVGCFSLYMYREVQKARAREAAQTAQAAAEQKVESTVDRPGHVRDRELVEA